MDFRIERKSVGVFVTVCGLSALHAAAVLPGTREALAELETGAKTPVRCSGDYAVGAAKEISRFQILPSVWREYSGENTYRNPNAAWLVTARILRDREAEFRRATGRQWDSVDLYIMWNAPGVYRRAKWDRAKVSPVVMERAKRFESLMQERRRVNFAQNNSQNLARN